MQAPSVIGQDRFDLSSDALLISSGMYAAVTSVVLPLWWAFTGRHANPAAVGSGIAKDTTLAWPLLALVAVVGFWIGPAIAWRLHGRRQRFRLVIAPLVSPVIVILLAGLGPIFAALYTQLLSPFTDWQYSGAAAAFAVLGAVHLAVVWHASMRTKAHPADSLLLHSLRIASLVALSTLTIVIIAALLNDFDTTVVQALLLILAIGYAAGLTTQLAAVIDDMDAQGTA
jgi:hypothetical protein